MYESGTEFKIILTDLHCPHKFHGNCQHDENIDTETRKGLKWCDEKICPLALSKVS